MNIVSGNRVGCARIVYKLVFWGVALALAVAVFLLVSCSSGTPAPAATQPAAVMAAVTQPTQLTATDEPTPWPTADLRYLEQKRADAELAAKIANNKQLEADAEQKKADAQSTTIANLAIVNTMEADSAKATATTAAMLTPTAAAVATQQRQGVINVQKQDDERVNNAAIAYRQNIIAWGWNILGLIGIPTGCIVLVLGIKRIIDTPALSNEESESKPEPAPLVNHVTIPDNPGVTQRIPDPPGDIDKVREWAEIAVDGESVAVGRWETSGPLTSNREYRHGVYAWLVKYNLMVLSKTGHQILNPVGEQVVRSWLARHPENGAPHSPAMSDTAKTAQNPSTRMVSTGMDSGGGVGDYPQNIEFDKVPIIKKGK